MKFFKRNEKKDDVPDMCMEFLKETYGESVAEGLNGVLVSVVYDSYKNYCMDKGSKVLSVRKFSEKIRNEFPLTTEKVKVVIEDKAQYRMRFVESKE